MSVRPVGASLAALRALNMRLADTVPLLTEAMKNHEP